MKKLIFAVLVALTLITPLTVSAATAFLVNFTVSTSVTGQAIYVCVYQYGGTTFERYFPMSAGMCPMSIEIY